MLLGSTLVTKLKRVDFKSHETLQYALIKKYLKMFYKRRSDFVSFSLLEFTLVIKLRSFDFEIHWNTSGFYNKKHMTSELNMSNDKISDFVSLPLFSFALVIKLRNFEIEIF